MTAEHVLDRTGSEAPPQPRATDVFTPDRALVRRLQHDCGVVTRARAPLRFGLAGGGTDLSAYSEEYGGAVLNCTIDRFAHASIRPRADGKVLFAARDLGVEELHDDVESVRQSRLPLHRGVYLRVLRDYCETDWLAATITTSVDVPAGSGLGSSSALVVALMEAFGACVGFALGQYDTAHLAYVIERLDVGLAGGRQDQYSAAFGGINFIEFIRGDRVIVNPLRVPENFKKEFELSLVACFSGRSRESASIITRQLAAMTRHSDDALEAMHRLKEDAILMKSALLQGRFDEMGEILNRSWEAKKATAKGVSNTHLDELYSVARAHGAIAGKVSGAGGGGFMMFLTPPEEKLRVIEALTAAGAVAGSVKLTDNGAEAWQLRR